MWPEAGKWETGGSFGELGGAKFWVFRGSLTPRWAHKGAEGAASWRWVEKDFRFHSRKHATLGGAPRRSRHILIYI